MTSHNRFCKDCNPEFCNNDFENCKYFQAYCHWCHAPIYEKSVFDIKTFWNQGGEGYPICDKCLKGLKTNGQRDVKELKKKLGLHDKRSEKINLEKWL